MMNVTMLLKSKLNFLVGNRKNSPLKKKESFRNGKYLVRNMTHEKIK